MNQQVQCPLCTQTGFQSVDALRIALVSAASRILLCPVCNAALTGLDKLTIHLFGHTLPQHDLHNVGQCIRIFSESPMTAPSEPKKILLALEESGKKSKITPPSTLSLQSFDNFQNDANLTRASKVTASEVTPIVNQDLSSLFCLLPLTCLPDKSLNLTASTINSAHCDLVSNRTTAVPNQNADGKGVITQLLGTAANSCANKDGPLIIVGLPSLQDMKRDDARKSDTNELGLSDVSSLSGKLLMLDCSGNSHCNNNLGPNNSSELPRVETSTSEQNIPHSSTVNMLSTNQRTSLSNREMTNDSTSSSVDSNIKQGQENEDESPKSAEKVHRCSVCFLQFMDSNILSLHQQLVHEGSDSLQPGLANFDQESSANQDEQPGGLKQEETFPCHLCSKTFQMQGSLMVHLRVAHALPTMVGLASRIKESILDPPPAASVSIPGTTVAKNAKEQVPGKNVDNKQWECSDCGKRFTTKYFLKKHKRLHTGEMPYSCPTCGKCFTFQQSYHKHLLYHSDEKPHSCTECGRSFKELSTLHNHQRIHTGEKPWACETCGKCFRQRVSYLVHRRIHTGAMPYSCTVCNKSFRYKVSQRTHKCNPQSGSASMRQSGELLQRLLFDHPEETCPEQNQENEEGKFENERESQFSQHSERPLEEARPKLSRSEQPDNQDEHGAQLLYTAISNDKPVFAQTSETSTSAFSLHNFQLQHMLSNIHNEAVSQSNAALRDVSSLLKDQLKQGAGSDENNSSWCADKQGSPSQNAPVNPSSLVVIVNDKNMMAAGVPNENIPVSLLQVLHKEKYTNEATVETSDEANNLLPNAPCPDAAKSSSNPVMSTPFVPDFLSMALSAPSQNPTAMTGCGSSNVPFNSDPFHWNVSLDIPNQGHNNSVTDNVCASQDTIDSLQSLLFGSPSAPL